MLTTVMVILDMTVVNVALPHMMGALGTTANQITWILTGYIVAEAVFIPMTGFLASWLGRKRLMLTSVAGFVVASALCGQAHSLIEIVLFRIMQGAFGASVIPLSQSVMVDSFPGRERGRAMAIWGIGIMLGPILGPTVGGYITQHLDWRWVFYINVPVGLINLWMIQQFISPARERTRRPADWVGAAIMATGVGSLQFVLDRGSDEGWFASNTITIMSLVAAVGLVTFAVRAWRRPDSIVPLQLLKDHNLAIASFMMLAFGLGLFGTIVLQPIMLQKLMNYPAETTGLVMAPRGLASAFSMLLVSRLINRFDPRAIVFTGLCLAATGTYLMSTYSLEISPGWVIWPGAVQGLGMGMIFVPLSTIAYATLPKSATDDASGIFNLARTIGASIGISIVSTILARVSQINWNRLGGQINPYNPALQKWLGAQGLSIHDAVTPPLLAHELGRQATMVAFVDAFYFVTISFAALAPLLLLMRKSRKEAPANGPQ